MRESLEANSFQAARLYIQEMIIAGWAYGDQDIHTYYDDLYVMSVMMPEGVFGLIEKPNAGGLKEKQSLRVSSVNKISRSLGLS